LKAALIKHTAVHHGSSSPQHPSVGAGFFAMEAGFFSFFWERDGKTMDFLVGTA